MIESVLRYKNTYVKCCEGQHKGQSKEANIKYLNFCFWKVKHDGGSNGRFPENIHQLVLSLSQACQIKSLL